MSTLVIFLKVLQYKPAFFLSFNLQIKTEIEDNEKNIEKLEDKVKYMSIYLSVYEYRPLTLIIQDSKLGLKKIKIYGIFST